MPAAIAPASALPALPVAGVPSLAVAPDTQQSRRKAGAAQQTTLANFSREFPSLQRLLRRVFSLRSLRPPQEAVLRRVVKGLDTLAVMPTGAGKSLCYQLPAVASCGLTVVVSPLIALMKDQADALRERGVVVAEWHSAAEDAPSDEAVNLPKGLRIVFTTPERLVQPTTVAALRRQGVGLLVVDEAHCIVQWGMDFRPAFLALDGIRTGLGRPPVLALTATATLATQKAICRLLGIPARGVLDFGIDRPNLHFSVRVLVDETERDHQIIDYVANNRGTGLVYAATVREAERLHEVLGGEAAGVGLYHGQLSHKARHGAQEDFMLGRTRVMVATSAFGMGIDKADIRFVLHAQMPGSLEGYYQECGRAGRDGLPAQCVLMYRDQDRSVQRWFASGGIPAAQDIGRLWQHTAQGLANTGAALADLVQRCGLPQPRVLQILGGLRATGALAWQAQGGQWAAAAPARSALVEALVQAHFSDAQRQSQNDLDAMIDYARSGACRWARLRRYFGQPELQAPIADNDESKAAPLAKTARRSRRTDITRLGCGQCDSCDRWRGFREAQGTVQLGAAAQGKAQQATSADAQGLGRPPLSLGDSVKVPKLGQGRITGLAGNIVRVWFDKDGRAREIARRFVQPLRKRLPKASDAAVPAADNPTGAAAHGQPDAALAAVQAPAAAWYQSPAIGSRLQALLS